MTESVQQAKIIAGRRVYDMKISHVFLQAFFRPAGRHGQVALFPNRWLLTRRPVASSHGSCRPAAM